MHEPGFDDDYPDMEDIHDEHCPCETCCFTQAEMDAMEEEMHAPFFKEDLDLPF